MSRLRRNRVDDALFGHEAERRQRRVVADARVAVLDRVVMVRVVGDAERHQQRRDQLEPAAEVVDIVGFRERDQRLDGGRRGGFFERRQGGVEIRRQRVRSQIQRERQHVRFDPPAGQRGIGEERGIPPLLFGCKARESSHGGMILIRIVAQREVVQEREAIVSGGVRLIAIMRRRVPRALVRHHARR